MYQKKLRIGCVIQSIAFSLFLCFVIPNAQSQDKKYQPGQLSEAKRVFAFFPETSQQAMAHRYINLTNYLTETLNEPFTFETRQTYPDYLAAIEKHEFDLAVVNAFDYVKIKNQTRYIPIVYRDDALISTIVTSDQDIRTVSDLRNKTIGYSSPYASAAISSKYIFLKNDLPAKDYTKEYFNGHIPCLNAVSEGRVDACVTGERIFHNYDPEKKSKLRVIQRGEPLPQLVVLMHPRLKSKEQLITEQLLALKTTFHGQDILDETYLVSLDYFNEKKYYLCEMLLDYISSRDE